MSVRRALVDCAVLALQDACVFYPCCKGCFSRVDEEQQDTTRFRCSKCGLRYLREQVDYRYRLSLRVLRDRCIFGVTVFGTCLNPFFGIHAGGLQRLVGNMDGPIGASTRTKLLVKAVEDCFIGRHFIFGIKVTGTESGLWFGGPVANRSSSRETVQFIASQMILPKASGLGGCTVVSYYQTLLQRAVESELGSANPSETSRPPAATLLMIAHHSPASSFSNDSLPASGLLSLSFQRSQHQDCTLSPTPPWRQSLGLITSSAEQEEGCSAQDSGDESSQQTDNNKTLHHVQRGRLENHKATVERTLSPLLSLEHSSYNSPSFAKYPYTSIEKSVGNTPTIPNPQFSPSQPGHERDLPLSCKMKGFSTRQLTKTFLSSSLAWEDLPFSESLTEFLCEDEKDFDIVSKAEPHPDLQNRDKTVRNNPEITSQDRSLSTESTSFCHSNTQITESHTRTLLDITNTPAPDNGGDRHNLSEQMCKNSAGCLNKSQAGSVCFHRCNQEDEEARSLSFENEDEQLEGDTYNCSADLFSSLFMIDMNTKTLNTQAETVAIEACTPLSSAGKRHPRSEKVNVPYLTPDKQKLQSNQGVNRDDLIPPGAQDLDFFPPAQSTPIVKVAVVSGSPASSCSRSTFGQFSSQPDSQDACAFYSHLPELDSKTPAKSTSSLCKRNTVSATGSRKENTVSNRHSHRFTPKRRFWKPNKHINHPPAQQHLRVQRGALNLGSAARINHNVCDVSVFDYEDSEVIVPPTPAAKTQLSVKLRRRRQTDNLDSGWEARQGDGVDCKRNLLDRHPASLASSQRGAAQTGNCDSEMVDEGSVDGFNGYDENQACDWSRDLFSDSA